ncbi:MAG: lasso peptide biosynthesis B2 protein [Pseudomonadota bacterium]
MRPLIWLGAFRRASWNRRLLGLEAAAELLRARILTALPARIYTRALGDAGTPATNPVTPQEVSKAAEIGKLVATIAKGLPIRAVCLQQVIATRRMLLRRGLRGTVRLGVREGLHAHAWLHLGENVVSGDGDLDKFAVIGTFS